MTEWIRLLFICKGYDIGNRTLVIMERLFILIVNNSHLQRNNTLLLNLAVSRTRMNAVHHNIIALLIKLSLHDSGVDIYSNF